MKSRKSRFGRSAQEEDDRVRRADEWVDTVDVHAAAASPDEVPADRSPFDTTGLDETSPEPYGSGHGFNGLADDEPVEVRGWTRRSDNPIEEIEYYIDTVLGTQHDPRLRRRALQASELGLETEAHRGFIPTKVKGLPNDVPMALPFPHNELRGARLVYETQGGYVIELERVVDGDAQNIDRQFYTVSRIGRVEQVLDRMRALEGRLGPAATSAPASTSPGPAPTAEKPLPGDRQSAREAPAGEPSGAWPEHVDSPWGGVPADHQPPAPATERPTSPADDTAGVTYGDEPNRAHDSEEAEGDEPDDAPKRGLGGLFGRRKRGDAEEGEARDAETFADSLPDKASDDDESSRPKRGLGGLFGRKKRDDARDESSADDDEPVPPAP